MQGGTLTQQLVVSERLLLLSVLLTGFALRLPLLDRFPFHQDEAIYSYWARYGRHVDPLFLHVWPDKPPLYLWLLGSTFDLLGATPAAARFFNITVSTLTLAVVAALARQWWDARTGMLAALLLALSPFAVSFAPTAFTDPLLVLAGMLALLAVVRRRYFWAGVWLGVAIMTKQQGVLYAPLVLGFGSYAQHGQRRLLRGAAALAVGLLLIVAPILWWDSLRWAVAPSPWDLGARNAAGFALAAPEQWWSRAHAWLELGRYLLGDTWSWWLLAALLAYGALRWRQSHYRTPYRAPALGLALWGAAFLALHIVTTVQVWDRYLLPLAPVVALLVAFTMTTVVAASAASRLHDPAHATRPLWRAHRRHWAGRGGWTPHLLAALLMLALAGPALRAAQGRLPLGGDHGAYTGLDTVAAWLNAHSDARPAVYQRNLGWHFQFYLFDAVQADQVELRWYPSAVYLADNAAKTPHRPRYLVTADWSPERNLSTQLALRRLTAQVRLRVGNFTVYELSETATPPSTWRICAARSEGRAAASPDRAEPFAGFPVLTLPQQPLLACPVEHQP